MEVIHIYMSNFDLIHHKNKVMQNKVNKWYIIIAIKKLR